ncbi:transposase [Pseudonocardia sp. H11422]|uniref:transposase n=1 Tax=Pseudonocardia sp. H11422 TaxID=2835866 RepID=UPI001BDD76BF|nr:transposase [Pseudonocardia sp. H11422]
MSRATAATLRRRLFTIPGRLVHTARRLHLRLPQNWPWADAFLTALTRINALPMRS